MTNEEKDTLRRLVKRQIEYGNDIRETVARGKQRGFKTATIRRYYKALS